MRIDRTTAKIGRSMKKRERRMGGSYLFRALVGPGWRSRWAPLRGGALTVGEARIRLVQLCGLRWRLCLFDLRRHRRAGKGALRAVDDDAFITLQAVAHDA